MSWHILTYLDISWHLLSYLLDISWHILTSLDISWHIWTYLDISWRILTYLLTNEARAAQAARNWHGQQHERHEISAERGTSGHSLIKKFIWYDFDACFFGIHMALSLHPHCRYERSCCVSTTEVVCTQMHFRDNFDLSWCCVSTTCVVSTHDASLHHGTRVKQKSKKSQSTIHLRSSEDSG